MNTITLKRLSFISKNCQNNEETKIILCIIFYLLQTILFFMRTFSETSQNSSPGDTDSGRHLKMREACNGKKKKPKPKTKNSGLPLITCAAHQKL